MAVFVILAISTIFTQGIYYTIVDSLLTTLGIKDQILGIQSSINGFLESIQGIINLLKPGGEPLTPLNMYNNIVEAFSNLLIVFISLFSLTGVFIMTLLRIVIVYFDNKLKMEKRFTELEDKVKKLEEGNKPSQQTIVAEVAQR